MTSLKDDQSEENLSELYQKGLSIHTELDSSCEDTNSEGFQMKVRKAILLLEDATRLVSVLDLFSRNERISEVPTSTLKFFLLPVLLGDLNSKLVDNNDRLELIKIVEAYYRDFLQRAKDYDIVNDLCVPKPMSDDDDEEKPVPSGPPDLATMNRERDAKIHRYKERKSLEDRLKKLKVAVDNPSCDDEVMREFYLNTIKRFVFTSLDELESFKQERGILKHMAKMGRGGAEPPKPQKSRPLKPIIITKDAMQKQVFGMGYTNLPVISIEEFYDERARNGWYDKPQPESLLTIALTDGDSLQSKEWEEAKIQEEKEEKDDEIELARKRGFDEYKDEHRRGEGNRHNMG